MNHASINGHEIPTDGDDMPCLTAMWTIMGKPPTKSVSRYKQLARFKRAMKFFTCYSKRGGKNSGTWASYMVALDYADYLGLIQTEPAGATRAPQDTPPTHDQEASDAEHEARMKELDEMARARRERDEAMRIKGEEIMEGTRAAFRGLLDSLIDGEDWKKGTIYDEPREKPVVNRCASYTMGPDDLDHLFFDFFSLRGGDVVIRCSVN